MDLHKQLAAAEHFLQPVLDPQENPSRGQSIVDRLSSKIRRPGVAVDENVKLVVDEAISFLEAIHSALLITKGSRASDQVLYNSNNRRLIEALLDLVALEGIYPNLLPGIGVPIEGRMKSLLQHGVIATPRAQRPSLEALRLLASTVSQLSKLAASDSNGLSSILRERILIDIMAAALQVACGPQNQALSGVYCAHDLDKTIAGIPASSLFPCLSSLLHPGAPAWMTTKITLLLSLLPMRPDGVRQTINFFAKSISPATPGNSEKQHRASISYAALDHMCRLLSSVPGTKSAEDYFASISPQLLGLLDDEGLQHASAYILNQGILNRRASSMPGTAGFKNLVEPLFDTIRPRSVEEIHSDTIVRSRVLSAALQRLSTILESHPNPGLWKRLMTHLLLPVWGIRSVARETSQEFERCSTLIHGFIRESAGSTGLIRILDNLCWDGEPHWKYVLDSSKLVEIAQRRKTVQNIGDEMFLLSVVPRRVQLFVRLLDKLVDDRELADVFLHVLKHWLVNSKSSSTDRIGDAAQSDYLRSLIYAQVAQELISKQRPRIFCEPLKIIELIREILNNYIGEQRNVQARGPDQLSLASLESIASLSQPHDSTTEAERGSEELISISLALLTMLLQQSDPSSSHLEELRSTLVALVQLKHLPRSSAASIYALLSQLDPKSDNSDPTQMSSRESRDRDVYDKAMQGLTSPQAPARAHGAYQLGTLIKAKSSVISVHPTAITLLSLVQDADSFVYLSAVRALTLLARLDPMNVINHLIEVYQDRLEQSSLDVRLRIGEAIQSIVDEVGLELPQPAISKLSNVLLQIAGRRVSRPLAQKKSKEKAQKRALRRQEAGVESADAVELSGSDSDAEELRSRMRVSAMIEGWEGKTGEEDVRIRSSALSIVGTLFERAGFHTVQSSAAVDVSYNILSHELGSEKAILRRAAVLIFMSLLKASDDRSLVLGFENEGKSLDMVVDLLQHLKDHDEDDIVRGHAGSVLESLEAWREQQLHRLAAGEDIRFGLEDSGKLRGLNVDVESGSKSMSRKPKIEELD